MKEKILNNIYKNRYLIAIIVFIICIILELNSSSIGVWNVFFDTNQNDKGLLLGVSRAIRSDEWATFTPMMFSQHFNKFQYFSNAIRATKTDVFIIYGLPVYNVVQIFRPFQLGFLFLGISKGLSFFWFGRLIALFMVSFEFFRILTKDKRSLSLIGTLLITFSPVIQWWFAVNGIVEIFFFGQLALIMLYKYMNEKIKYKRLLYLLTLVICAGGYILVLYPAWQIPMFYAFLPLAIYIIIENKEKCKIDKKDILYILFSIILLATALIYIYTKSGDTIKIIMNTSYPGKRFETGGNTISSYFRYLINIFLPYKNSGLIGTNSCEMAVMYSIFPLGLILSIINLHKKKDTALLCLLISYIFLSVYCILGFPNILAKLTLLSNSQAPRTFLAVGYIDILLLIRSLSINKINFSKKKTLLISFLLSILIIYLTYYFNTNYIISSGKRIAIIMILFMLFISFTLYYLCLRINHKNNLTRFNIVMMIIIFLSGMTINPIRTGTSIIYKSDIIKNVQKINNKKRGIWITEGMDYPKTNYILLSGVQELNCTNVYPTLNRWKKIDKKETYKEIYNRYAHIKINITNEIKKDKFNLINPDYFEVYLTPNEITKLNINYIFTENDLEKYNNNQMIFKEIYKYKEYKIYSVTKNRNITQ